MTTSLIVLTFSVALGGEELPERLETALFPVHQRVELTIDPDRPTFAGRAEITVEVPARTKVASFQLHAEGLSITSASMLRRNGRGKRFEVEVEALSDTRLRVEPPKALRAGRYALEIAYEGPLHDQPYGLYRFEAAGKTYVVSQLEADEARTAWPCFDEPAYKIPWQLVVTAPAQHQVISNAPIAGSVDDGETRQVEFGWTPPMPSYAVALAVGPYVATEVAGVGRPSSIWTVAGRQGVAPSLAKELPAITQWLEEWFGSRYPYDKLDFIAVPRFAFGAMENPGAVVMREEILFEPETASDRRHRNMVTVAAHEVAHMWFGDLVTLEWWDDFWLNEAFAAWMGRNTLHALHPEYRGEITRVNRLARMLKRDGRATARPLRTDVDPAAVFETVNFAAYDKGEALLDMTRAWLGAEVFRDGLHTYLDRHGWSNATYLDLFAALEEASGKPVADVLDGFLSTPGAPALAFEAQGDGTWQVRQSRFAELGQELQGGPWTVPLRLRLGRPDGSIEVVEHLLQGTDSTLDLGPTTWLHPAADGFGYFAWSLDDESMGALLAAMGALDAPERRSILAALDLRVASGAADVASLLESLSAFDHEDDPAVLRQVMRSLTYLDVAGDLDDDALEAKAHRWQRAALGPQLKSIGMEAKTQEAPDVTALRQELLDRLADAGDRTVRSYGLRVGRDWLDDPSAVPLTVGLWGLTVLAEEGDMRLHRELLTQAGATEDPAQARRLLFAAASVPGRHSRDAALDLAVDEATGPEAMMSLYFGVQQTHDSDADQDFVLDWMFEHYEALASKISPVFRSRFARSGDGCDLERFNRSKEFFGDPARAIAGTERALKETEQRVRACMLRRERYGANVRAFLEAWSG